MAEALVIAEAVTGIETKTLSHVSRLDLLAYPTGQSVLLEAWAAGRLGGQW